ncbi:M56 family metallopeptidase [Sabulilitoribacter arenilitoris]|uniref:M56 family metallopeptidase n=1 Tax=Wocania arenilitoris TaxID=2044858 RepID=A0AAE3EMV3_9FLAO|nr:M56 family metallopeptidase [Wocania arenilitoris]MCF7568321.1 M56 family metallopeptidase [Wocania arenilitoris]
MLYYIIQTIAFQLFFLIVYDVFLKRETFFNWNRMYLLATAILSLILPFIKVSSFKTVVPQNYIISLPEVVLGQSSMNPNNTIALDAVTLEQNSMPIWELVFYIGLFIACGLFLFKLFKIVVLVIKNPKQSIGDIVLVELVNSNAAFSFFHYIFLGEKIKAEEKEAILKHELIHTKQKHTLDLLFFEVLRILFWFNPLVYMYQNRIRTLHEFIADANAVKHQDKNEYYQNLLSQVFETRNISFINTFFKQSLIKKRIVMLSKAKSKQIHLIKYALLIPLVFGMLVYTSAEAQEIIKNERNQEQVSTQDLTDKQLKEKFYKEILEMDKMDDSESEIITKYMSHSDKYIISKEEYYKNQMYYKFIFTYKNNIPEEKISKGLIKMTYDEYLEWKKSDEAKYDWENKKMDVMRLVVKDLDNITVEENEKYIKKEELFFNDKHYKEFVVTDGKDYKVIIKPSVSLSNHKPKEHVEVPFAVIEQVPVFPGCEGLPQNEQKKCISDKISKFVARKFNTDLATQLGLVGRQRINVIFKIDKEGNVTGIRSRAPHPDLEAEAIRVIKTLPKMTPGKHNGKHVIVPYSLPIIFQLQDKSALEETVVVGYGVNKGVNKGENISIIEDVEVPFAVIENVPVYPGCEDLVTNAEKKSCMSEKLSKFVIENFNTKKASEYGLQGRQRINVIFKIDKKGNIIGVRSRGPHPALEAEAIRVISSLPKIKPGMQKGKAVTVPYSLPIVFEVEDTQLLDEVAVVGYADDTLGGSTLPFAIVDKAPILPECKSLATEKEKRECTSTGIQKFINRNFNTDLAESLGLKGRQLINVVFKITKKGKIEIEKSRAPHPDLGAEAMRVIKSIPKLIPGKHNGKKVDVTYSIPIVFQVHK